MKWLFLFALFASVAQANTPEEQCDDACFFHDHLRIWTPDVADTVLCQCEDGKVVRVTRDRDDYIILFPTLPYYYPLHYYYPYYDHHYYNMRHRHHR